MRSTLLRTFQQSWQLQPFRNVRPLQGPISRAIQTTTPSSSLQSQEPLKCEELQIPVPWGHMSAKWWGRQDIRPVLTIHGYLDNAGTFDRLIPLLPRHVGYLAIDLPGHGLSSHYPAGMSYSSFDFMHIIEVMRRHYGWEKVSLLTHSMGSQLSTMYAAIRPELPDLIIGVDLLKPLQREHDKLFDDMRKRMEQVITDERRRVAGNEPPSYTYDQLIERMVVGTNKSVTPEVAPYLIDRSIKPSKLHPDRFYFSRDNRLKLMNYIISYQALSLNMLREIKVPHLFIKATNSPYFEPEEFFDEAIEVMQKTNPLFKLVRAVGAHHIHLTDPEAISADISDYLIKYRKEE